VATITPFAQADPAAEPPTAHTQAAGNRALGILLDDPRAGRPVHVEHIPARAGREVPWPPWVPAEITGAFAGRGIPAPWSHQAEAACHAQAGRNVIISTGAASGKSLGYLLPALSAVLAIFIAIPAAVTWWARPGWRAAFTLAGAWVLADLARQFVATGFPWNLLGSVWEFPGRLGDIMIQPAALVGGTG